METRQKVRLRNQTLRRQAVLQIRLARHKPQDRWDRRISKIPARRTFLAARARVYLRAKGARCRVTILLVIEYPRMDQLPEKKQPGLKDRRRHTFRSST